MPDTGNAKYCHPQIFIFYLKKCDLTNLFDQFHSTVMFSISFCLNRACFTHLISSDLSCDLCLWYFDQLVHLNKEINANVYRHSLWEYPKLFHCSFELHLTPHMTYLLKPVLGGHPVLSRHYCIPRGCLLNTGFTVLSNPSSSPSPQGVSIVPFD